MVLFQYCVLLCSIFFQFDSFHHQHNTHTKTTPTTTRTNWKDLIQRKLYITNITNYEYLQKVEPPPSNV